MTSQLSIIEYLLAEQKQGPIRQIILPVLVADGRALGSEAEFMSVSLSNSQIIWELLTQAVLISVILPQVAQLNLIFFLSEPFKMGG